MLVVIWLAILLASSNNSHFAIVWNQFFVHRVTRVTFLNLHIVLIGLQWRTTSPHAVGQNRIQGKLKKTKLSQSATGDLWILNYFSTFPDNSSRTKEDAYRPQNYANFYAEISSETTPPELPIKAKSSPEIVEESSAISVEKECLRKKRCQFKKSQKSELEKHFLVYGNYIPLRTRIELATRLDLTERQIKVWYQNRRQKERKLKKGLPPLVPRSALESPDSEDNPPHNLIHPPVTKQPATEEMSFFYYPPPPRHYEAYPHPFDLYNSVNFPQQYLQHFIHQQQQYQYSTTAGSQAQPTYFNNY